MRCALLFSALAGLSLSILTSATTCPTGPVIRDGGFESGTRPSPSGWTAWTTTGEIGATTYGLTSPGSPNNGGTYAFTANLYPSRYSNRASGLTLVQTMNTCAGRNYSITVDYRFSDTANNNCALSIRYPFKTTTGSVTTGSGTSGIVAGSWYTTGSTFQAVSSADPFSIVFSCSNGANNRISVDNVNILPFNGNAF